MATTINSYSVGLTLDAKGYIDSSKLARGETQSLIREINQARTPAENYSRSVNRLDKALASGAISQTTYNRLLDAQASKLDRATAKTSSLAGAVARTAAAYVSFRAVAGAIGTGVQLAADAEQAQIAFKVLLKDADLAKDLMGDIRSFAAATPFQFPELRQAGQMLLAFKFSANEVIPALGMLGNIAAATNQPIGELAEIIGKARVQNQIYAEDLNQLTGRGINVLDGLAARFNVTTAEVKKLASESKITFDDLYAVLTDLGNTDFAGMLVEQSETINGQWSTLKDNVADIQRQLGEMMLPTLKEMSVQGLDFVRRMKIYGELVESGYNADKKHSKWISQKAADHITQIEQDLKLQEEFMRMQMADPEGARRRSQEHMARIEAERAAEAEKERLKIAEEQARLAAMPMADADVDKIVREHEKFLADMHKQQDKYMRDLTRSISDAERNLQRERDRRLQQMRDVSAGPGAGIEVGSAEAARFAAQQANAAIGAAVLSEPTPAEQEMIDLLEKLLDEAEKNGFSRIR